MGTEEGGYAVGADRGGPGGFVHVGVAGHGIAVWRAMYGRFPCLRRCFRPSIYRGVWKQPVQVFISGERVGAGASSWTVALHPATIPAAPGSAMPMPISPHWVSAPAVTTGTRPEAGRWACPSVDSGSCMSGSGQRRSSLENISDGGESRAMSRRPLSDARVRSQARFPVSLKAIQSARVNTWAIRE